MIYRPLFFLALSYLVVNLIDIRLSFLPIHFRRGSLGRLGLLGIITKGNTRIEPNWMFGRVGLKLASVGFFCATLLLAAGIVYSTEIKKPPPQICEPKSSEVAVRSASGNCAAKGPGIYPSTSAIGLGDEPIDMISIGSFAKAIVCGIDTFSDLRCEGPLWQGGRRPTKLPTIGDLPWTFLQVGRSAFDFECKPEDTGVAISGTIDGKGPCIRLAPGTYQTLEKLGLADLPLGSPSKRLNQLRQEGTLLLMQKIRYVRIGARVQAKMCEADNFLGLCWSGSQSGFPLFVRPFRSMKVWNVCVRRDNQAALFNEQDAFGPCTILEVGEYLTAESLKMEGGVFHSIEVGPDVEARMCSEENLEGKCVDVNEGMNVAWTIRSLRVRLTAAGLYRKAAERGDAAAQNEESKSEKTKLLAPQVKQKPSAETKLKETLPQKAFSNSIGMEFVLIPAGSFTMGSSTGYKFEKPPHNVKISQPFYLQATEVSQGQWKKVMGDNPSGFKQCGDDCPVEQVSWEDAQRFIEKLNQLEATKAYRLPSEAEWEYACRAGTTTEYSFRDDAGKLGENSWYGDNSSKTTQRVAGKKPNSWGLYDMHGNVWEWVEDDGHGSYERAPADGRAWVDNPRGSNRVVRGGGWFDEARDCRSAMRGSDRPGVRSVVVGFRLSRSVSLGP